MKKRALLIVVGLLVSSVSNAADLNGAWANDLSVCNKVFEKKKGVISVTRKSDNYGSGFIVEGNRIRGKIAKCAIKSRKEEGALIQLITTCSTDVALQTVQFSLQMDGDNKLTRVFPGVPELAMTYARCPL